jgi:UDP-N-acetylglucosamine acyltransferase
MAKQANFHPTAVIERGARVDPSCQVGPYAVIGGEVVLGPDNVVEAHAMIQGRTQIGEGNRFSSFCSVGAAPQVDVWPSEPGSVSIADQNVFRESVTVNASCTDQPTRIGSGNLLMAGAHVGHDVTLGSHVHLANGAVLGGHVTVEDHAWISGLAAIHQHVRIGAHAFVAGGAIVVQDVPPFCTVQGDRARLVGLNLKGLRRAGFSASELSALKRAYQQIFVGTGALSERLLQASATSATPAAARLIAFFGPSSRGVLTAIRRTRA